MTAPLPEPLVPAGFWRRYAAWSLDAACLLPGIALLGVMPMRVALARAREAWIALAGDLPRLLDAALAQGQSPAQLALAMLADPSLRAGTHQLAGALTALVFAPVLLYVLLACVWALAFEASAWQATPGKRALRLTVTDAVGQRLPVQRVLVRFLAAGLSWLTLNLGHAMAAFAPHLALHDRLSQTRVIGPRGALPAWAKGWLLLQIAAACAGLLWLFRAMQAAMQGMFA